MIESQSAGGVVVNDRREVLVVNQRGRSWSMPKGHIDEGEDPVETAKREIYEESGVSDLTFVKKLGTYQRYKIALDGGDDKSDHKTITMFLFRTSQHELGPVDELNPEARWVPKEKVAGLLSHRKDRAFFIRIKNQL